jgi:hypothetical protein
VLWQYRRKAIDEDRSPRKAVRRYAIRRMESTREEREGKLSQD